MRVLHLTTELPPVIYGGLGTAVGGLVTALARAGMAVGVLLIGVNGRDGYGTPLTAPQETHNSTRAAGELRAVTVFQTPWWGAVDDGVRFAHEWRPDIVHLHAFWAWPVARALQERLGLPVVYTVHSLDRAEYDLGHGPPECLGQWETQKVVITTAQRVIALSRNESELLASYCPEARDRVRIVGNGIDIAGPVRPKVRRGDEESCPVVLYSGRLVERKGIGDLLAAIPLVMERAPTTRFVLAGGHRGCSGRELEGWWLPPHLYTFRQLIHFTGWLTPPEVEEWYRAAQILVVPSWYEPFGMVILEGMSHGLPIVAADVGGPAEILEHNRTGLLFPPRDVEALARTILRLIEDPPLGRRIGAEAAESVRRQWLWPQLVKKIRVVYQEAIDMRS